MRPGAPPVPFFTVLTLRIALAALLLMSAGTRGAAAEAKATADQGRFFETSVRPVLAENCFKCHGDKKQKGGLRLDSRAAILAGGDSGPVVEPGKPEDSLLIAAIHYDGLEMPPKGKLSAPAVAALVDWVKMGAPWPGNEANAKSVKRGPEFSAEDRAWWSFQPVKAATVPQVDDRGWSRGPLDRFIFRRMQAEGLSPAPEADRTTLIRRVTFDLTGLPPTPEEIDAFVNNREADAYDRLVDRLLDSPRYGERWARHWLDLVRYADSDGYRIDHVRPNAWLYRDYVIRAFNDDKPYDRFVREQLAGDELYPGDQDALVATGYLRHWIYEYNNRDVRGQWSVILNDITDTTGDVFLGLGLQCARCHNHKFDPILQADYFRLQAFFAPILPRDDVSAATTAERQAYQAQLSAWESKTEALRRQIADLEARYREAAARTAIGRFPDDIQAMIRKPVSERSPLEHQLAELAFRQVLYEYSQLDNRIKGQDKERVLALRKQLAAFDALKPRPLPAPMAVTDVGPDAPPVVIPKKGDTPIAPGFLTILEEGPARIEPSPSAPHSTGRRAALARWLTRPDNPLSTRVIVNRVWQYHFGRGLAVNTSDFGRLGEAPTHPELLDWLTSQFVQGGWKLKPLHRMIVSSAAYRQSTEHPLAVAQQVKDPENRFYWRAATRRLDAEQIRDAILAVTGELDRSAGGPGSNAAEPRRTIYTKTLRNTRDPLLDVFDLPLFFSSASGRDTTTTPIQSLFLINSQMMILHAQAFVLRLVREEQGTQDTGALVRRAYRLAYGREPSATETDAALKFLCDQARRIDPSEAGSAEASFLRDRIPHRDGHAAILAPDGPQQRLEVPHHDSMTTGDFTVEAFFLLHSIYDSGAVRTLVAKWNGSTKAPGWAFGVTGKGSRRKPQTLVIQLIGDRGSAGLGEAAVFSDQHVQLDRPYYAAASVSLASEGNPALVTFYLKDLSNDEEPLQIAKVTHQVSGGLANAFPLSFGGRGARNDSRFDGLIDDVRLSDRALDTGQLLHTAEGNARGALGYWKFETEPGVFRDSSGHGLDLHHPAHDSGTVDPQRTALVDFCQILLNSNEFLYAP